MSELLKPRYEQIGDYPGNDNPIGTIFTYNYKPIDRFIESEENWCKTFEQYPNLFRKLSWWEHRKPEEMPEYVKRGDNVFKYKSLILHRDYPEKTTCTFIVEGIYDAIASNGTEPATLEDYTQYHKKVKDKL